MINYTVSHGLPEDSDLDQEIEDEMTEVNYKNTTFMVIIFGCLILDANLH